MLLFFISTRSHGFFEVFTAAGAAIGFKVVDTYLEDARAQKVAFVQNIIDEEREKRGLKD